MPEPLLAEAELHKELAKLKPDLEAADEANQLRGLLRGAEVVAHAPERIGFNWLWYLTQRVAALPRGTAEANRSLNSISNAVAQADRHGQVMGLFTGGDGARDMGYCSRVAVGQPAEHPRLWPDTEASFEIARDALIQLMDPAGVRGVRRSLTLAGIRPALPALERGVEGTSAGLAFAIALFGRLLQLTGVVDRSRSVADPRLAVTAGIATNGALASLHRDVTATKLRAAAEDLPGGEVRVLLATNTRPATQAFDIPPNVRLVHANRLVDALQVAFPELVIGDAIARLGDHLAAEANDATPEPGAAILRQIEDIPECQPVLTYCNRDPLTLLALACYLAFAIRHLHVPGRAPSGWPSPMYARFAEHGNAVNAIAFARELLSAPRGPRALPRLPDAELGGLVNRIADVLVDGADPERPIMHPTGERLAPAWLRWAIHGPHGEADDEEGSTYLTSVRRYLSRPKLYTGLLELLGRIDPSLAPRVQDVLARRVDHKLLTADAVGSEEELHHANKSIVANLVLGGAWILPHAIAILEDSEDEFWRGWNLRSLFGKKRSPYRDGALWENVEQAVKLNGGYTLLNERVFHPRVLSELLSGANVVYSCEKLVVREALRQRFPEPSSQVQHLWSYDCLPVVADLRRDVSGRLDTGVDRTRLGDVRVQDYAAYGRTNAAGMFFLVGASADIQTYPVSDDTWAAAGTGFYWAGESTTTPDGRLVRAVNTRSLAVWVSEWVREQLVLNNVLDPDAGTELADEQLLSLRWRSLLPVERYGNALAGYLWGRSGPLPDPATDLHRFGADTWTPLFHEPRSWRGIGVPTMLAWEAQVAVVILRTVETLSREQPSDKLLFARAVYRRYVRNEYRRELSRMHEVVTQVLGRFGPDGGLDEIRAAADTIARASDELARLAAIP